MYAGRCCTLFVFEDPGFLRQLHRVPVRFPLAYLCLVSCVVFPFAARVLTLATCSGRHRQGPEGLGRAVQDVPRSELLRAGRGGD